MSNPNRTDEPDRGIPLTGPTPAATWRPATSSGAAPPDPPRAEPTAVPIAAAQAGSEEDALNRALDNALVQLDRVEAAAAARDGVAPGDRDESHERRLRLRSVLTGMSSRVTSVRSARAAELATAMAEAEQVALRAAEEERTRDVPASHPFRTGFLGGLGLILAYVTYLCLDSIRDTIIVIVISAVLAIGLDPAVAFLTRHHMRRGLAVTVTFLGMLAFIGAAIYAIIPPIVNQVASLVSNLPATIQHLKTNSPLSGLETKFGLLTKLESSNFVKNLANVGVSAGVTAAGIVVDIFVVMILTLFILAGIPKIKAAAYRLAPASSRARVSDLGDKILKQMGGYLVGATLVALQAGLVAGAFAAIAGLPYPFAIALGAALLDFVPVVGPIVVGVSMTLIGFTQSLTIGIVAGGFYICQHLFEAYWLYPRVMRRQVDISTGAVVVAILIGGALLGVTGGLLAVPVAAAVQLIIREVVVPRQERH